MQFQGLRHRWEVAARTPPTDADQLGDHPPMAAHLLYRRGIRTAREAADFLEVSPSTFEDPAALPDIAKALQRLQWARERRERTAVYGDFDADGVTGTALLVKALRRFGLDTLAYIPHRVTEGHGLNEQAIAQLHAEGARVIVTVDCGATDVEAVARAKAMGIDVIITDHHLTAEGLPDAVAIINPHAPGSEYPFDGLTGVGMALKLAQALLEPEYGPAWADGLMELAAIGTITDMAPLLGENRYIVTQGIGDLRRTSSVGLRALMRVARVEPAHLDATAIGFGIGPRLNAAGRLDHAHGAYELLVTESTDLAEALATELDGHNSLRQTLTGETLAQARDLVPVQRPPLILVGSPSFNPGVVGLVAGKLAEEYGLPAVVYALDGSKVRASCRSAPGFHWGHALKACGDLLLSHGGHAQAAGFTCDAAVLGQVQDRLEAVAAEWMTGRPAALAHTVDAEVDIPDLMGRTLHALRRMEPFGVGNPTPVFLARNVHVVRASTMGADQQHARITLRAGGALWDAVAFGQTWVAGTERMDIVFSLAVDRWNGTERLRLQVEDYAPSC